MENDQRALSFGPAAANYDRARPTYPADVVAWALGPEVGPGHGTVVDIGAGTGLLTRVLVPLAGQVVPVEPDRLMRTRLAAVTPEVTPLGGSAEAVPLDDASADAVVSGQAYHWFDRERAHAEAARVLRPGGHLAALWNLRDEDVPWVAELTGLIEANDGSADTRGRRHWHDADFGPEFGPVERFEGGHRVPMDAERLVGLVTSRSYYLVASQRRRAELEARVRELAAGLPETFDMPYVTVAYRGRRR